MQFLLHYQLLHVFLLCYHIEHHKCLPYQRDFYGSAAPSVVAFLNKYLTERHILDMLHHLAIKIGDVTTATQMVWVVVELHLLVCVALLEVILCSSHQSSCLSSLQAAVIAAEALTIDIIVVVIAIVRYCKGCLLFSILSVIFIFIFPISQIVTLNITIFNSIQR